MSPRTAALLSLLAAPGVLPTVLGLPTSFDLIARAGQNKTDNNNNGALDCLLNLHKTEHGYSWAANVQVGSGEYKTL